MRDPARIDRMLDLLRAIWHQNQDMRLTQLLLNSINNQERKDIYDIEDDRTEENLRRTYYMTLELQQGFEGASKRFQIAPRKNAVCPKCGASDYIDASQSYDCNRCGKSW